MRLAVFGLIGGIVVLMLGISPRPSQTNPQETVVSDLATSPTMQESPRQILLDGGETAAVETVSLKPVLPTIDDVPSADATQVVNDARQNMLKKVAMLKQSIEYLNSIPGYTATISKQEEVKGQLLDEQTLHIKCRQNPFSVYLLWLTGDEGREVIYIEGANDGKIIAHDGGWKARIPAFHLPPDCPLAMRDTRYPASCAGIRFLIDQMLGVHEADLKTSNFAVCDLESEVPFNDCSCLKFTTRYHSKNVSSVYRKSVTLIDRERNIPLHSEHYGWPAEESSASDESCDAATLLERYTFNDFAIHNSLTDHDFDRSNKSYNFR